MPFCQPQKNEVLLREKINVYTIDFLFLNFYKLKILRNAE